MRKLLPALPAITLALSFIFSVFTGLEFADLTTTAESLRGVNIMATTVLVDFLGAESTAGWYIISGDPTTESMYEGDMNLVHSDLKQLSKTMTEAGLGDESSAIQALADAKITQLQKLIMVRKSGAIGAMAKGQPIELNLLASMRTNLDVVRAVVSDQFYYHILSAQLYASATLVTMLATLIGVLWSISPVRKKPV